MEFETLTQIYYTKPDLYEEIYHMRYTSSLSEHIAIAIKQYNRRKSYPAFFYYTNEILLLLEQLWGTYEEFLKIVHDVPPIVCHQFALLSILDEVKSTNDIEGVHSTRKEIRAILDGTASPSERLHSIVQKYHSLLDDVEIKFDTCQDIRDFYDEFAHKEIVAENSSHRLDGVIFRKESVEFDSATGKVIHKGLYPESKIITTMEQALQILHAKQWPLWVRLGLFHYFFAYIHPFYDGNGRTDRFITSYFLQKRLHKLIALRLSVFIKKNRSMYYKLFMEADSEINRGDLTPFITGFLHILKGTIEDTIGLLSRKNEQLERFRNKIQKLCPEDETMQNLYYILLQAALFYGQGISISKLMEITGKSRPTIQKRLSMIPPEHLIVTKSRKIIFYKLNLMVYKNVSL